MFMKGLTSFYRLLNEQSRTNNTQIAFVPLDRLGIMDEVGMDNKVAI